MKHPLIAQVEAYWQALRNDGKVPLRSAVDPRGIESALEHAFILERIAPGTARFRLAGMHLNDLMGMEVRGMPLTALFDAASRNDLGTALEHMFEMPGTSFHTIRSSEDDGDTGLSGQMVLLPLRSDLGDVSRALGCFVTTGTATTTPHRFSLDHSDVRSLDGSSVALTGRAPAPVVATDAMDEAPRPYTTVGSGEARRGAHLRVVHDADREEG